MKDILILNPISVNLIFYKKYCKNRSSKTPGTPKNPAINAVMGLIAMVIPIKPPKILRKNNMTAPIIPLIMNFTIIFMGTTSNIPTMYIAPMARNTASIVKISIWGI